MLCHRQPAVSGIAQLESATDNMEHPLDEWRNTMQLFQGQIRFGIHSGQQNASFSEYLALWQKAEQLGLDWASVFDHFLPIYADPEGPCFDGLTLLSAMAAHTQRIRCGVLVAGNTYRNPAILANIATTIDHISAGRLEFGIGAGWYEMEHNQYDVPFYTTGRRIRMLGESAQILKGMWTQHRTTFEGKYYTIKDALCEPKPIQSPHIPLWIGGTGEQLTLRVVAESADGWNTFLIPPTAYRQKLDALAAHCKEVGRDPASIRKSLAVQMVIRETEVEVAERVHELTRASKTEEQSFLQRAVVGTPEQCTKRILEYVKLGVGDFLMGVRFPVDMQTMELFAKRVAPAVKDEGAALLAGNG
jgi:F420-dependent oxidoreductase-like protein